MSKRHAVIRRVWSRVILGEFPLRDREGLAKLQLPGNRVRQAALTAGPPQTNLTSVENVPNAVRQRISNGRVGT